MNPFSWWRMLYWKFRWYVYPRHRYATRCQYCGVTTGETLHAWATEDVCAACTPVPDEDDACDKVSVVMCARCGEMKPPPSCDDDLPNVCDDCWNTHSSAPEAVRGRERRGGEIV